MAKSKVTNVLVKKKDGQAARQGSNGVYYIIELTFADGTKGDTFAKSESEYSVGQELEFTYTANATNPSYNGSIKIEKPRGGFGGGFKQQNPDIQIAIAAYTISGSMAAQGTITNSEIHLYAKSFFKGIKDLAGLNAPEAQTQTPKQ